MKLTDWKEILNNLIKENPDLAIKVIRNEEIFMSTELLLNNRDIESIVETEIVDTYADSYIHWNYKCYTDLNKFYDDFYKYYANNIVYTPAEDEILEEAVKYTKENMHKAILVFVK